MSSKVLNNSSNTEGEDGADFERQNSSPGFEQRIAVLFLILGGYLIGAQLLGWAAGFATYRTFVDLTYLADASRSARAMMWFASRTEMHLLVSGFVIVLIAIYLGKHMWIDRLEKPFFIFSIIIFVLLLSSTITLSLHMDLFPVKSGFDWITFRTLLFLILDIIFLAAIIVVQIPSLRNKIRHIINRKATEEDNVSKRA
ncbi:MAG: hypothetical protein JW738_06885 [Actinobacteria bacterium]|nr:hypothetical protein [Actinomycetota bacterium]